MSVITLELNSTDEVPETHLPTAPQLIMDSRCAAAINRHMSNLDIEAPEGNWKFVKDQAQAIYDALLLNDPNLFNYPNGDVLQAPINNGVLYPLKGVRGLGIMFLMNENPRKKGNERLSVAATFWFSGSVVCIGAE